MPSYAGTKLIEHHIIFIQANSFNPSCLTLRTFQKRLRLVVVVFQLTVCAITSNQLIVVLSLFCVLVLELMFLNVTRCFFKYWWDEEMSLLKEASVESDRVWKAAGKPRNGPIFAKRQSCRLSYRKRLKESNEQETKMIGLPDGQESFKTGLAVLIQYRRVTSSQPPSHVAT